MINNSACLWIGTTNNSYYSEFQALTSITEKFIVLIIFADYGVPCQKPVSDFRGLGPMGISHIVSVVTRML